MFGEGGDGDVLISCTGAMQQIHVGLCRRMEVDVLRVGDVEAGARERSLSARRAHRALNRAIEIASAQSSPICRRACSNANIRF